MSSYDIGISGFNAAQRALDVIGNNIANAATEGYHRQELDLRSAKEVFMGGLPVGQGVKVEDIFRVVDKLLDTEIVNQESVYGQMSKELDVLKAIEGALGELSTEGLSTAMDNFYDSLHYLSTDPNDANLQHSVVTSAESLSHQFRMLGTFMKNVQRCKEYIYAGDVIQVVLSQRFEREITVAPFDIYRMLRIVNPSPYMFFISMDKVDIVFASI